MNNANNQNICGLWCRNAIKNPNRDAIVHYILEEVPVRWSYLKLISTALKLTEYLKKKGIKEGDVCAIIIRHNPFFYPVYLAISFAGAIPAVLAYPNKRLHPEKFRQGLIGMSQRSGLDWILSEAELEDSLEPLVYTEKSTVKGIIKILDYFDEFDHAKEDALLSTDTGKDEAIARLCSFMDNDKVIPESPFLLQHSSGTTGLQKPVILSNYSVLKQAGNCSSAIGINDNDRIVSWLPLYHDMGLIAAFHIPLINGITSIQIDPFEWVVAPSMLFDVISSEKATVSWLPNFSYNMMSDKIRQEDIEHVDLSSLRMLINCSEPVRYESHKKFIDNFGKFGIGYEQLSTSYGMAEATFAVTQTPAAEEARVVFADRNELKTGVVKLYDNGNNGYDIRKCVSSGKTINGCEIKIIDEKGNPALPYCTGEILVKSESIFSGYRNYPEKTAEVLRDGWYYSGDLGFIIDDYLYVIGRKKDIIIVAGNNIYPEDVEDTVTEVPGVIPGRVIAFGEDDPELGSEQLSVIAETKITDEDEKKKLRLEIKKACQLTNVTVKTVYLVPPRWLIKSSSGKTSRSSNSSRILELKEMKY